jgi:hypothetical protein
MTSNGGIELKKANSRLYAKKRPGPNEIRLIEKS